MGERCRSCLSLSAAEYISMEVIMAGDNSYLECFNECTQLKANFEDKSLPLMLCMGCSHDLQIAYDFIQNAREADITLKSLKLAESEELAEQECVMEELLEDEMEENANMEMMEFDTLGEQDLEDSLDVEDQKPNLYEIDTEQKNWDMGETSTTSTLWQDDEMDDMYLIEYKEEAVAVATEEDEENVDSAPSGSKWKCNECYRVLRGDVSYEGHMNWHKGIKPYKCTECFQGFRCKGSLETHAQLRHQLKTQKKRVTCTVCNKGFRLKNLLEEHLRSEHQLESCTDCFKTFDSVGTFEEHMELVHSKPSEPIQCPHCSTEPFPRSELGEHFRTQHPEEYTKHFIQKDNLSEENILDMENAWHCDICNRVLSSEEALKKHLQHHSRSIECTVCGKLLTSNSSLRTHMKRLHSKEYEEFKEKNPGDKVMKCDICSRELLSKNMERHMQIHEKKKKDDESGQQDPPKYLCSYCPKAYHKAYRTREHEKLAHKQRERKYKCPQCDERFFQKCSIQAHIERKHQTESKYTCNICGNKYKTANQLYHHSRVHQEKKIKCPQCDKKYLRQTDFRNHLQSHSGDQPYVCDLCNKRYSKKHQLKIHMDKHNGRKHICDQCGATFNDRATLREHSFKHTGMPFICEQCPNVGFPHRKRFIQHMLRAHEEIPTEDELNAMFAKNTGRVAHFTPMSNRKEH